MGVNPRPRDLILLLNALNASYFIHPMPPRPSLTSQHDALSNCTNLTLAPLSSGRALVKRPRLKNDEGTGLKRVKYTSQESLPEEKCEAEFEEDDPVVFCAGRTKRTFFHARQAFAMSRPGVTCRFLPCKSRFTSVTVQS